MRETVLVVGGAGYIGSHTAKILGSQGYEPVILDDLSTGHRAAAGSFEFHQGDFRDTRLVSRLLKERKIGTVMHFGAKALVDESMRDPLLYYEANVAGTVALLRAMIEANVGRIIFSSTCAVFGLPRTIPITESERQEPINVYGRTKLFVERILKDAEAAYGVRHAILRYFNAAGADPDGVLGEDHAEETHLIPRAIQALLGRASKLVVNGNDYPTADGSCIRDYVHVNDLAAAHIRAMELIRDRDSSVDFNLGSEKGYSIFEVIRMIEKVTGRKLDFDLGPRRPGDPPALVADSSKARKNLEWTARYDFEAIVRTAYAWMERHPRGYAEG